MNTSLHKKQDNFVVHGRLFQTPNWYQLRQPNKFDFSANL